jgi:type II secretory ATPase GspE/PulE/Tfp pilus assembly ATPase PilB-like protein
LRGVLERQCGLVLVAGPRGSGKSTTVHAILACLAAAQRDVRTTGRGDALERGHVSERAKHDASRCDPTMEAQARDDSDAIVVGDVGDPETAARAVRAVGSSALVVATIEGEHAGDGLARLAAAAVDLPSLASTIVGVVGQQLVRITCPSCREPARYPEKVLAMAGMPASAGVTLHRGRGCPACGGTGYQGRTGVFEILPVRPAIADLVAGRAGARAIEDAAIRGGMHTLGDEALRKALLGVTTIEEVLRVAYA